MCVFIPANKLNKSHIGNIVGLTIRGAGCQWVKLLGIEKLGGEKVELTVKMITHNAHMGIRTKKVNVSKNIPYQTVDVFLADCKMYKIEANI